MMMRIESITHAYNQVPWRKQVGTLVLFLLILVFAALVAGLYLNVTARATTVGSEIQESLGEIARLERENNGLKAYLAGLNSVESMQARAIQLGFEPVQTDQAIYLLVPGYLPSQPVEIAPGYDTQVVSAQVIPAEYTEPLLPWLRRKFINTLLPALEYRQ